MSIHTKDKTHSETYKHACKAIHTHTRTNTDTHKQVLIRTLYPPLARRVVFIHFCDSGTFLWTKSSVLRDGTTPKPSKYRLPYSLPKICWKTKLNAKK